MGTTQRIFRRISSAGFTLSLIVHLMQCTGLAPKWGKYPLWLMAGVFVVGLPTMIVASQTFGRHGDRSWWWKLVLESPPLERTVSLIVFSYTILNFMLGVGGAYGDPQGDAVAVRLMTGHCLAFYWTFVLVLRARLRER